MQARPGRFIRMAEAYPKRKMEIGAIIEYRLTHLEIGQVQLPRLQTIPTAFLQQRVVREAIPIAYLSQWDKQENTVIRGQRTERATELRLMLCRLISWRMCGGEQHNGY